MVVIATGLHNGVAGVLPAGPLFVCQWHPFGSMC
jgi:hypothetical protein